jgi:hypothetical protein
MSKIISELNNLDEIRRLEKRGIYKRCLLKSKEDYSKMCDYMQKINYCIQDLNSELPNIAELSNKSIVYIITLVTWISEAMYGMRQLYRKDILKGFSYEKEDELKMGYEYIRALRSFVVAHPLTTTDHSNYGMDGSLICVDIRFSLPTSSFLDEKYFSYLDYSGYHKGKKLDSDFYLYGYSKEIENMEFSVYIGCSMRDIYHVAELYIDKLYALDKYFAKQKGRSI